MSGQRAALAEPLNMNWNEVSGGRPEEISGPKEEHLGRT